MTTEHATDMTDVRAKLLTISADEDGGYGGFSAFGRLLAPRLNPQLVPAGFILSCELLIHDLSKGVDGFTSQPMHGKLVGMPPQYYAILSMSIPRIAELTCPPEFARAVQVGCDEIRAAMNAAR